MTKYQILIDRAADLALAQQKARSGKPLSHEDRKLLAIEVSRLEDIALGNIAR